ncbi:MAG: hypothetical protein C0453_19400, partial [Comamonadaceae bacterium]|nr:hypothetical protein [Comamonadaceae bacterium]
FSWNIALRETDPVQAFFSPVTRIWELLAGSILGYVSASMPKPALQLTAPANSKHSPYPLNWMRHLLSLSGFGLLFAGVLLIDQGRSFPGWWALIPAVGSWALIASGPTAWFNHRILSLPWLVFVGHISYPLYLWHWPLLSFLKITETDTAPVWMRAAAVMVALLLAWATYRWLETPIRRRPVDRVTTTLLVLGIALSGLSGFAIYRLGGLDSRASVQPLLEEAEEMKYRSHWVGWQKCSESDVVSCRLLNPGQPPEVAIVGDSHAGHLASGIAHQLRGRQTPVLARVRAGCFPMYDRIAPGMEDFACRHALMNGILDEVIAMPSVHTVVLSGYGVLRINGDRGVPPAGAPDGIFHNSQTDEFIRARAERFDHALDYTLNKLQASGKRVVFVIDVPELNFNPRQCTQMRPLSLHAGKQRTVCEVNRTDADERSHYYRQAVENARFKHPQVRFVDSWEAFCNDRTCSAQQDGRLLYSSRDHLSPAGSRFLMDRVGHEIFP